MDGRGIDPASRQVHVMGSRQWPYMKHLLQLAGGAGTLLKGGSGSLVGRGSRMRPNPISRHNGDKDHESIARHDVATAQEPGDAMAAHAGLSWDDEASPTRLHHKAGGQDDGNSLSEMWKILRIKEALHNDASSRRKTFPGGPDDYRLCVYDVDTESGAFSVSVADCKANGERPSHLCD